MVFKRIDDKNINVVWVNSILLCLLINVKTKIKNLKINKISREVDRSREYLVIE